MPLCQLTKLSDSSMAGDSPDPFWKMDITGSGHHSHGIVSGCNHQPGCDLQWPGIFIHCRMPEASTVSRDQLEECGAVVLIIFLILLANLNLVPIVIYHYILFLPPI